MRPALTSTCTVGRTVFGGRLFCTRVGATPPVIFRVRYGPIPTGIGAALLTNIENAGGGLPDAIVPTPALTSSVAMSSRTLMRPPRRRSRHPDSATLLASLAAPA